MTVDPQLPQHTASDPLLVAGPAVSRPAPALATASLTGVPLPPPAVARPAPMPAPRTAAPGGDSPPPPVTGDLGWLDALDWSMEEEASAPTAPPMADAESDDDLPITDIEALLEDPDDAAHWIGALPESPEAPRAGAEPVEAMELEEAGEPLGWSPDFEPEASPAFEIVEGAAAGAPLPEFGADEVEDASLTAEGLPELDEPLESGPGLDMTAVHALAPAPAGEALVTAAGAESLVADPREAAGAEIAAAASDALGEVADRLERIAASLRNRSSTDLLSGADTRDPLELLLTGFVLGYASRSNAPANPEQKG